MPEEKNDEMLIFNGLNGKTGEYLLQLTSPEGLRNRLAGVSKEDMWSEEILLELEQKTGAKFPLPPGTRATNLDQMGWGVIFPSQADPRQVDSILEALSELIQHRKRLAKERFKIYRGIEEKNGGYRPGDSGDTYVVRLGGQPGSPDLDVLPYYLLIIADPQSIPFQFQYDLDVQRATGRIYFESLDDYANYARSVVVCETLGKVSLPRRVAFFGVANNDDKPTHLSADQLVTPLYDYTIKELTKDGWQATKIEPADSTKKQLTQLMGGTETPALLFTASHGLGWPYMNDSKEIEQQYRFQGSLVCQDWPGPLSHTGELPRDWFFSGEDIDSQKSLLGMVAFFFACYGAATPYWDDFAASQNRARSALAHRAFLADLPKKMLSHPRGGALAVIGHVERAWGYSFAWRDSQEGSEPTTFQYILHELMLGAPVGYAMDHMNVRYAELSSLLSYDLGELKYNLKYDARKTTLHWTGTNDARGYAIIGDPAVKIPLSPINQPNNLLPQIEKLDHREGTLPVVLVPDSVEPIGNPPPLQEIVQVGETGAAAPPTASPYASAMDGLAFALSAYTAEGRLSFTTGTEGVNYNILDDAKNSVQQVVANLYGALQTLSSKLAEATNQVMTLEVTTSVVNDLENFIKYGEQGEKPAPRFYTMISAGGDIKMVMPNQAREIDEVLLQVHKDMVEQAMQNRTEMIKAIGDLIASLFAPQK